MTEQRFVAVRAFRGESQAKSGKRGRRLVLDTAEGGAQKMAYVEDRGLAAGMEADGQVPADVKDVAGLALALATSKTPVVLTDDALTAYVNEHDGQLPAEGLAHNNDVPDDFVDQRPAAVTRREKRAEYEAKKAEKAAALPQGEEG